LKEELRKADVDADSVLIDGVAQRRVLRGAEAYLTTWGPVQVERTLTRIEPTPTRERWQRSKLGSE
jgi:hypothetical protein